MKFDEESSCGRECGLALCLCVSRGGEKRVCLGIATCGGFCASVRLCLLRFPLIFYILTFCFLMITFRGVCWGLQVGEWIYFLQFWSMALCALWLLSSGATSLHRVFLPGWMWLFRGGHLHPRLGPGSRSDGHQHRLAAPHSSFACTAPTTFSVSTFLYPMFVTFSLYLNI